MKVYLRSSGKRRNSITRGKRIGGGGAGDVYQISSRPGEVIKIYRTETIRQVYAEKVEAMLAVPPLFPPVKKGKQVLHQLAWPTAVAETKSGEFLGFAMPEIDYKQAISLERMLQKRSRETSGLPAAYRHRVVAAFNVAALLTRLHERGHHVIDLKPVNLLLYRENMRLALVDCDGFSILGADKKRYSAGQFTLEYIAPENIGRQPSELGESQDRFSLAVIIFRLLNNGLHPYQGRLRDSSSGEQLPTLHDSVAAGFYPHGRTPHPRVDPSFATIHESFPPKLRELFDRAFQKPSNRPTAREWQEALRVYADPQRGQLRACERQPEEHGHFGHGCGWCDLESRVKGPAKPARSARGRRRRKRSRTPAQPPPQAQPIALAPLVHASSGRWFVASLAAVAIALAMSDCPQLSRSGLAENSPPVDAAVGKAEPSKTGSKGAPSRSVEPKTPSGDVWNLGLDGETEKKRRIRSRSGLERTGDRSLEPAPGVINSSGPVSRDAPGKQDKSTRRKRRLKQFQ